MADTDTTSVPTPIFSADESVEALWVKAYQGEVLGELLFGLVADGLADPGQAAKMRVLSSLERRTKEAIEPSVERAGLPTEPDADMVTTAEALAPGALAMGWAELMATLPPITEQYIPLYERIGELDPSEQAASELLVAHEKALRDFARAETAGETETSLDAINALAHMH
jgi:hypothetical protein